MIEFACHCGFGFSVQDDMAGAMVQCPKCRRLNDVPLLSDLESLEDGGIYKLDEPVVPPPLTVQERHRAFTREHFDDAGQEIDLRPTMDDVMRAGGEEVPRELHDELRPGAPKYDPFTGELIQPLDVKPDGREYVNPSAIPLAKQALSYATHDDTRVVSFVAVMMRLLRPANIAVMVFVLLGQFLLQGMWITMVMGFAFIFLAPLILFMGLVGHYGNVIDEIGLGDMDELPAPLRNVSLRDDVWSPFTHVAGALMICFVPALIVDRAVHFLPVTIVTVIAGAMMFPAVVLTTSTSGSSLNLRPDRVFGVIRALGRHYITAVIAFIVAAALVVWGQQVADAAASILWTSGNIPKGGTMLGIGYIVLAAGVFFVHAFCYYMGVLYRAEHMNFPWVLQRHIPRRLQERIRPLGGHLPNPSANSARVRQKLEQPQPTPPSS